MPVFDDMISLAVALGIGLLIGAERERRKGRGPLRSPAGIRTFAQIGLKRVWSDHRACHTTRGEAFYGH